MGIPVAGTAVLILFVLLIVCVCLHVRHEKNRYVVVVPNVRYLLF